MDQKILGFLRDLSENNNREWFTENKDRYQDARLSFESFINELIPVIRTIDPLVDMITARDCTFRIYRDVRFSKEKSPYKTNMGAYIARGGKSSTFAGYYVHAEPGQSFLAGGLYMPPPETLKVVRQEIFYHIDEFKRIISAEDFVETFGMMDDPDKLIRPPKGYSADFPDIEWLKYKNYAVMHKVPDDVLTGGEYLDYSKKIFRILYPLNNFFNRIFIE